MTDSAQVEVTRARRAFDRWCPIKIVDAEKAPKTDALVKAYWTAWQACESRTAKDIAQKLRARVVCYQHNGYKDTDDVIRELEARANEIEREYKLENSEAKCQTE